MPQPPFLLQLAWLAILLLPSSITRAQIHIPTPVYNMGFASQINKALIIYGGLAQLNPNATNNQLFALDLTVPRWETSSPPWRYLTAPATSQSPRNLDKTSMVLDSNETSVMVFDRDSPYLSTYDVASDTWLDRIALPTTFAYRVNYTVALDPATNIAYLGRGADYGNRMMVYDTTKLQYWPQDMPSNATLDPYISGYSFVYCASRKSILLFGGRSVSLLGSGYNPYVYEFQMGAYSWIRLNTVGDSPTEIYSHCMVPAYDGFKMVVFGGSVKDDTQLDDIYILDMPTMTWSKGSAPSVPLNRSNMACTVSGDNFIAWGGFNAQKPIDGTPIIYNLRDNKWTTTYSLPTLEAQYNWGAIIGGIVSALVVAAGIGFFYYRRRKLRESLKKQRTDVQPTTVPKQQQQQQHHQQEHQQEQLDTYRSQPLYYSGAGPSVEHGSTYKGSLQHRLIDGSGGGFVSPSMSSIAPLFARNNSARFSLNSTNSSSFQQQPVELYEKGYYVPESSRRNPQFFDPGAAIPYDDSAMVPVDLSDAGAPWMTPQSSRRNPQLVSSQLGRNDSLQQVGSEASGGTLVNDEQGEGGGLGDKATVYHEACSSFSDARIEEGGSGIKERGIPQEEATATETTPADLNNTYHSPLQSAILPTSTLISSTLVASNSQTLDTNSTTYNYNNDSNYSMGNGGVKENQEWFRLESERLEQERLAYLDRLAQLQSRQNL